MPEPEPPPWQITDLREGRSPEAGQIDLQETLARLLAIGAGVLIVAALPAEGGTRTYRVSPPDQIPTLRDAAARFAEKHKDA